MVDLPAPREPGRPYAVALVCLGNICRSPTAQVVLEQRLAEAGLADAVTVTSAGTGTWHLGELMDDRAAAALHDAGYDPTRHRARKVDREWFTDNDLLLAMDAANRADLLALAPDDEARARVLMFRAWDPQGGPDEDVPDPWYGSADGFTGVLEIVERTATVLVAELVERLTSERDPLR